ncbi:palmitoyltransferase ZDHHC1 [Xenopus laevis]|uniref:Palmitoyltransferase n=2 Tax=Xenopus laevis TaxID=8355 RepID=A0A1L8GEB5_XENLA|nr:palmitoyltransferase ZDHHC1 [Xenopus laevis]XP_041417051.1 palmitoyltransferase ZDHHC1 [Xenopus laevis]OCT82238.1 hypothetical protein XELAEV_18024754mg [Xenopus laevis]
MSVCKKQSAMTVPDKERGEVIGEPPQHSRKNGWSGPLHLLQLVAWCTFLFFAVIGFGILVPLLPQHWLAAGYICTGVMFTFHCVVHFLAVTVDPADDNVQAKDSFGPLPVFDRNKHAHVIENMHCYICEVDVGPKSKHCSICNKCVSNFDHHCKWLNNCVGGKNYWLFFNCLISAFLGTFLLSTISTYVFVEYFVDPAMLRTSKQFEAIQNLSDVWFVFLPAAPVETKAPAILALAAIVSVMGLITILLIGQLLCFHVYLLWNKLSTYEYIMHQRQKQEIKSNSRQQEDGEKFSAGRHPMQEERFGGSLIYTNPDVQIEGPLSGSLKRDHDNNADGNVESNAQPSFHVEKKPRKKKKKKRKKSNRVTPEAPKCQSIDGHSPHVLLQPPPADHPVSLSPSTLAVPAFSSRLLPVLAPINGHLIQAAGPPAEYHSDSAESMEEIPVAQTHLGSSSMSENLFYSQQNPIELGVKFEQRQSYLLPHTTQQKFELRPKVPAIFVSESSGAPLANGLQAEPKKQNSHSVQYNKMWVAKGKEGEQVLSMSNAEYLTIIKGNALA